MKENINILIIGSGGREHAITWRLAKSATAGKLFVAPGNAGTEKIAQNVPLPHYDFNQLKRFIDQEAIDLIVVGPEQPLVDGFVDKTSDLGFPPILGPDKAGARLEGSKAWSKGFMQKHGIPTAAYGSFTQTNLDEGLAFLETLQAPYVLKADGLAAGKGVLILESLEEAKSELREMLSGKFGDASAKVVIEEFMAGRETSFFALCDGQNYVLLPEAKDYKRIGEGDTGLNTGGMGTLSPVPFVDESLREKVVEKIVEPTLKGLKAENIDYKGFLFFGLMITPEGEPKVVEYNVRLGDPETQVILPRLESDFAQLLYAAATGQLGEQSLQTSPETCLSVILASGGYPEAYEKGKTIDLGRCSDEDLVFHAGTKTEGGQVLTNGGRVLAAVGKGNSLAEAQQDAYHLADAIAFEGKYCRRDIGKDLL